MSIADVALKVESLYRETILTKSQLDSYRHEFSRLQDKVDKLMEMQMELRARLIVAEQRADELPALRDRVTELEARFKASLEAALMTNAREGIGHHVQEFLRQNMPQILAAQILTPGDDGARSLSSHKSDD